MGKIKSVGVDPGSMSWDVVCLRGQETIWQKSLPTESIKSMGRELIDEIVDLKPDVVSAPSGYGLPLTEISDLDEKRRFEITLRKRDEGTVMGLLDFLNRLKETELKAYILPSVKHLRTVPVHRKINKIDMGTPDKVCSVAYSMYLLDDGYDSGFTESSFIHCELGYGFNAFIAVEGGRIVDGIGGSMSSGGNLCPGMVDMELAYLRGVVGKEDILSGGYESINQPLDIKGEYLVEAVMRDIYRLLSAVSPEYILFSFRDDGPAASIVEEVSGVFEEGVEVVLLPSGGDVKNSALGSAFIANGLAGGVFKELVDVLGLRNSSGSVFDYIYPPLDVSFLD